MGLSQPGDAERGLVAGGEGRVPIAGEPGEGGVEPRGAAAERAAHLGHQAFRLLERVADAAGGDGVLVVPGVAGEHPAGPGRLPEEVLLVTAAVQALRGLPAPQPLVQRGRGGADLLLVGPAGVGADLREPGLREVRLHEGRVVVGAHGGHPAAGPLVQLHAVGGHVGPVRVVRAGHERVPHPVRRRHQPGDGGAHAVRAHHQPCVFGEGPAPVPAFDPGDPARPVPPQPGHPAAVAELGPGLDGRVHQQRVQNPAPRGELRPLARHAAGAPLDADVGDLVDGSFQRRAARRADAVQHSPAGEGGDPGLVDEVRGEGVGAVRRLVEQEDPVARAGQQQGGGRTGAARPDHDDVVHAAASQRTSASPWLGRGRDRRGRPAGPDRRRDRCQPMGWNAGGPTSSVLSCIRRSPRRRSRARGLRRCAGRRRGSRCSRRAAAPPGRP